MIVRYPALTPSVEANKEMLLSPKWWELDERLQGSQSLWEQPIGLHGKLTLPADLSSVASRDKLAEVEIKALYRSGGLLLYGNLELALGPKSVRTLPAPAIHNIYIRNNA